MRKWYKTKRGVAMTISYTQKKSSEKRGHRPPEYTTDELIEWLYSQVLFHVLYSEWVNSGYKKSLKPSVDRKHDDIHYCMSNIQLMTWGENANKEYGSRTAGRDNKKNKAVIQFTKNGEFMALYYSVRSAAKTTNLHDGNISRCANRKRHTTGGFKWSWLDGN